MLPEEVKEETREPGGFLQDSEAEIAPVGPPFPIVGIGASAGGLEAVKQILANLGAQPGLAVLYVAHLDPRQKSHLKDILKGFTQLTVKEVHEGMVVEANHLYLIPPNTNMALTDGKLSLTPRAAHAQHMPIDYLFRSLATIQKNRSIGVILSGGGTDGTLGFQAIKGEGGITIAQDEKTAAHPSMPRSAILDGHVDYVLAPREIAQQIERFAHHPYTHESAGAPSTDGMTGIFTMLQSATGVEFSHYKQTTVTRRVQRRMALRECHDLQEYVDLLRRDADEIRSLYQDLLIRVTQFFRDPGAFAVLKEEVFPALLQSRAPNRPIRIWVAGCSTGEEVYSIAITLLEFLEARPAPVHIKILATDLNEEALQRARSGTYIDNIELDVSAERLRRFFNRVESHYQINKAIRDLCVFSRHNLASDPPFSHVDLLSCRNVLIYMDSAMQKRVVPILHYALQPDGYLLLGPSENVSSFGDLFTTVEGRHRVFRKQAARTNPAASIDFGTFHPRDTLAALGSGPKGAPTWSALDVQREADRIMLARYAPVGAIVDEAMTVVQFRGRTAPFLEPAPGMASLDLLRMVREGLLSEVRGAVDEARLKNKATMREGLRYDDDGSPRPVRVEVVPFKIPSAGARFFLILFKDLPESGPVALPKEPPVPRVASDVQVTQLQQELVALREYLQSVIEEQESTNEELKSANEEILSANEELQSTNEELQTAKEEAQSANEELATVNEELRHRNAELARANNDLVNFLGGVGIPIVMVGRDLRIRRFTPPAERLFNLIATDIGRPISDIKPRLNVPELDHIIGRVIDTLTPYEKHVQALDGQPYFLRVRPYVTVEKTIDGASIVVLDIHAPPGTSESRERAADGSQ